MYLGLDIGQKTLGLSISYSGQFAETFGTIRFPDDDYDNCLKQLIKVIDQNLIKVVVIGLPKHMNGDIGIRAEISFDFQKKLNALKPDLNVILYDERLTTKQAKDIMIMQNASRAKYKKHKDELAAQIILQSYLSERNKNEKI